MGDAGEERGGCGLAVAWSWRRCCMGRRVLRGGHRAAGVAVGARKGGGQQGCGEAGWWGWSLLATCDLRPGGGASSERRLLVLKQLGAGGCAVKFGACEATWRHPQLGPRLPSPPLPCPSPPMPLPHRRHLRPQQREPGPHARPPHLETSPAARCSYVRPHGTGTRQVGQLVR